MRCCLPPRRTAYSLHDGVLIASEMDCAVPINRAGPPVELRPSVSNRGVGFILRWNVGYDRIGARTSSAPFPDSACDHRDPTPRIRPGVRIRSSPTTRSSR